MENLNATGSLSLTIDTSGADAELTKLETRLAKIGMAPITSGATSQDAAKLRNLELEVEALTKQLTANADAKEKLGRVTRSWSAAEGAARASFRENSQLTGEQVKNLAKDADRLKQSLKEIKVDNLGLDSMGNARIQLVGRIQDTFKAIQTSARVEGKKSVDAVRAQVSNIQSAFEDLSGKSRVSSGRMKSLLEGMFSSPSGKPGQETVAEMNAAYRQLEQAGSIYQQAKQRNADLASSFGQLRVQAVQSITATNSVLQAMGLRYKAMEQQDADKQNTRARADLVARNNRLIEQEEKSHLSNIAAMRAQSSRTLAEQASADLAVQKAAASQQAEMLGNMERMRASWQSLGKAQSAAIQAESAKNAAAMNTQMGNLFNAAKVSEAGEAYTSLGRRVFAAKVLVEQFGEQEARAFLGKNAFLVDRVAQLDSYTRAATAAATAATNLARAQSASVAYAAAGPRQQAALNLRAGIALDRGYDTSGYAAEALEAARAAGSVEALRAAKAALVPQTQNLTAAQRTLSESVKELHTGARGLAGSFGALWMTYGSLVPLLAGAALGAAFKSVFEKGAEFEYQLTFVKALGGESAAAVQKLSDAALDLGKNGLYGPIKVAEGMRILAQAGLDAREQLAAIPQVLDLATVGELGVDAAAETLVGVATAFGKTKLQLQEVGDVISKAAAISQTSVQGMTESMKYASVVGEQYNVSLEDTSTALAVLAKLNITGTSAGTAFRNMVKELYTPTAEASKAFKLLGLETKDSTGNLRNMVDIIYDLKGSLEQYDKASQTNILQKMFGERGAKEAIAMLAMTREEWNKLRGDISDSQGFMGQVAAELEATTKGTLKQAFNTLEASLIEVFNTSKYGMGELAADLKDLFGSEEFKQTVAGFVQVTMSAAQAIVYFKEILVAIAEGYVIGKVALGVEALSVAFRGVGTAGAAASAGMVAASGAGARFAAALAPLAGPAGIVALLATGMLALWANSKGGDEASQAFTGSLERMNNALDRQYKKLLDSNNALRERIRLANGQPEASINTTAAQVKDAEAEYTKRAKEFNSKVQDMQKRGLYTGSFNLTLNKEREELNKQYEEVKKLRTNLDKTTSATIDNAVMGGRADQADRDAKRRDEIRKLVYDLRNSKKQGAKDLADQLEQGGVLFGDIDAARGFLDKGKKTVTNDTWSEMKSGSGRSKSKFERFTGNPEISNLETQTRSVLEAYKRAETSLKGQAKEFTMAYPDAIAGSLAKLEETKKTADALFDKMDAVAGSNPEAQARAKAARQRFNDEYLKEQQALNQELAANNSEFLASTERAMLESGAKVLSTEELYQREWHSKFGGALKEALLRSTSNNPEIAEQGRQMAKLLQDGFKAGLDGTEIEKALKTISTKVQAYQAQMSVLLKKDQDGGIFAVLFGGSAADINSLRNRTVRELESALYDVESKIQNWNASDDSDKRLQLIAERDKLVAQVEEAKLAISPSLKDLSDTLGMGIANALTNGFKAGENPGKTFAKNIGDAVKKSITKALADTLSKSLAEGLSGLFGSSGYGDIIKAGLKWLTGSDITGSTSGSGGSIAGYASTLGSLNTLYKASAALYAKLSGAGTAVGTGGTAGGTGLTVGAGGQTGLTLGAGGQTGLVSGSTATTAPAASTSGLSTATIGWVAAIAAGMYMSSQAWKAGVRPDGKWSDSGDVKSWPMRFWDNQYYLDKAMYGKEFAGSELNAILSGSSLSKVVHEAIFGGSKRDTGELALRATLSKGEVDTDLGAYWKKSGGLFSGSKKGIRWSDASADMGSALEEVITSVKDSMVKLGSTLGDNTLASKIANFTGSFEVKIGDKLNLAFADIGKQVRDGLAASLFTSVEGLRKTTTDTSGKSTTEEWSATFERVIDQANFVVGMVETMGKSVTDTFGKDNAERVLNISDAFVNLFGSLDVLKQQWDSYYQGYFSDSEKLQNVQKGVAKTFAELGVAVPNTRAEFRTLVEGLDLATVAGQTTYSTLIGVSGAFGTIADASAKFVESIATASKSISESFQDSIREIRYGQLDNQGKYAMLDTEAAQYIDVIKSLTDVAEIEKYATKLNEAINTAFALVDPTEQTAKSSEFIDRLNTANDIVQERLEAIKAKTVEDQKAFMNGIVEQVKASLQVVQVGLEKAAEAIPETVDVRVNIIGNYSTEVGYEPNYAG